MTNGRPVRQAASVASIVLWVGCAGDSAGPLELKLAHAAPPESLISLASHEFARRANLALGERARVVVFEAGQLGSDQTVLQKLKLGTIDFGVPATVMSSAVEAFALFEMPYLVRDREHLRRIEEELFWSEVAPHAEAEGYRVIALWENGFRHVTNNSRPIREPADLKGIKIRTPNSPWRVAVFRAFGAAPSPMPFTEVFTALQTGVMDGQENPLTNIANGGLAEVQEYLSLTGHVYSAAYLTVGIERWEKLPEDVRVILERTARETQAFVHETARVMDERIIERLRAGGIRINDVNRDAFARASTPVYENFSDVVPAGRDWIDRALALGVP